jgi:indolepyruvate ferredoxin oxidoreductase beta subunit
VNVGRARYPSLASIERGVKGLGAEVRSLDATSLAQEAGNLRTMNVVMLGALASTGKLPIKTKTLKRAVRGDVPEGTEGVDMGAFELGFKVKG